MTPDKARSFANDIACAIATLKAVADELRTAYPDSDYGRDDEAVNATAEAIPAPEPSKTPTLEDVRAVLGDKSRNGFQEQVRELITKRGATKLSAIDPSEYPSLLKEAEELG